MKHSKIGVPHLKIEIVPYAFQYYSRDFYQAYLSHKSKAKFSPARLFLLCRSLELAAKSLHLNSGAGITDLTKINHNLELACDESLLEKFKIKLSKGEKTELKKANEYYKDKGFEYFLFKKSGSIEHSGPELALTGWPGLPNEKMLEAILQKLLSCKSD